MTSPAPPPAPPENPLSPVERRRLRRGRNARLPVALVLGSLLAVVLLPIMTDRRTDRLRDELNEAVGPARAHVAEIQTTLALEAAARRGYLLTGDRQLARSVGESRERRRAAERELAALAERLDGKVARTEGELARRLVAADAHLDSVFATGDSSAAYVAALSKQQARFRDVIQAADSVDAALVVASLERQDAIQRTEQRSVMLTVALVLLALSAAAVVAHLGRGFRSLALRLDESESRFRELAEERERLLRSERDARAASEARREELERVTESRARLIRGFTHDVKNPLGAADGYLELLQTGIYGALAATQHEAVGKVRRSIRVALDLIGHLLDLARAESGQLDLRREPVDVRETAREVLEEFSAQAAAKSLRMALDLPPELPPLETDPGRTRQILANLVSNAVKYTPEGGRITVRVRECSDGAAPAAGAWAAVDVEDTGHGIRPDQQALLFDEFTRFDPEAAQGSGIGLAISDRIARALRGRITVRSAVGAGSTFTLWLPLGRDGAPPASTASDGR
ncbi:MAG: sensor histidine kinase [Gemmatimonadaceae bacterium]